MTVTPSPVTLEPEETSGPTAPAVTAPGALDSYPAPGEPLLTTDAEERVAVATQAQLMWRRFRKHRLAMLGAVVVILFYLVVVFADFLAYANPEAADATRGLIAPQRIQWFHEGQFQPHVFGMTGKRDPTTFKRVYTEDPTQILPLTFFAPGFDYKLLGFIPMNRHLIGVEGANPEESLFLLGTDLEGRDMWSRVMFATRTSLTIGLIAVAVSLVLGVALGGVSGFYGGVADTVIQRVIEILRSIPTIPLWMGLAAAMPKTWSIQQVYFTITIIISLIGWTELARVVRGRFLSLRQEDFVTAADLVGASQSRIIFVHMVPLFLSHIIAATTLALPAMIISETALSFLGLGLRPPAISWGVLLQQAQNVQTVALSPWLLLPAVPVILVILAFNFLGDGLRDAADPYT
jgi:peptide/nickel transport system permease protein